VAFVIKWPVIVPTLSIADTLTLPKNNLPAVRGQKSVRVVYQQSVALSADDDLESALLIDADTRPQGHADEHPAADARIARPRAPATRFSPDLDPDLRQRLFWVPFSDPSERLQLKGLFVEYPNYHYLRLNLMTPDLIALAKNPSRVVGIDLAWTNAINDLPTTRIEMRNENEPFDTLALVTPGLGAGYVTMDI
jgi:hypothetical protein